VQGGGYEGGGSVLDEDDVDFVGGVQVVGGCGGPEPAGIGNAPGEEVDVGPLGVVTAREGAKEHNARGPEAFLQHLRGGIGCEAGAGGALAEALGATFAPCSIGCPVGFDGMCGWPQRRSVAHNVVMVAERTLERRAGVLAR